MNRSNTVRVAREAPAAGLIPKCTLLLHAGLSGGLTKLSQLRPTLQSTHIELSAMQMHRTQRLGARSMTKVHINAPTISQTDYIETLPFMQR